ncbi:MAG: hypothetical protein A3K67_07290 [Euryarchaeota archaeon RBG_16_62_10]|nr:MAG: hypothetical protein A3K67_07290 [Euryarchaeota archaeon RBG_16_62_10]
MSANTPTAKAEEDSGMIKNLFTKHEHRSMQGITKEQAMQAASWFWRSRQFGVNFTAPYSVHCEQYYSKLGLRQSVDLSAADEGQGVAIDISFSAGLTDEGAVVGALGAVLVLPVVAVVGVVSYVEYENDAQRLMNEFWSYLQAFPRNQQPPAMPAAPPSWSQPAPAAAKPSVHARSCPSCGVFADDDAKFCKNCGAKL